ncbi:MAG: DUF116 domain-containing protein [Methanomassiliicoccus sp.]|nr:DUF116 domain-containing protein [Methanomassiliicoccus sp.]
MAFIGYALLAIVSFILILGMVMLAVALISMRRGRFYLPWLLRPGLIMLEGLAKTIWKIGKVDDREISAFSIRMRNQLNRERFSRVPMKDRAVFLPQCLRSSECPSHLTTEGLVCKRCMRCDIGRSIDELEAQGCKVFIVPGSTFLTRMVKKYRPQAIIGVGCLMEVKEGLDMLERKNLLGMGVVTTKDGCVETTLDWSALMEAVTLQPSTDH